MIITCEECQARFRLADEKVKPGGTKVRCSKCRHVFTVMPPEAAPAEEVIDFGAFNMEPVGEEPPAPAAPAPIPEPPPEPAPATPPVAAGGELDLDFSGFEASLGSADGGDQLAEEFSFADTSVQAAEPPAEAVTPSAPTGTFGELELAGGEPPGELDFDATFAETEEAAGSSPLATEAVPFRFDEELPEGPEAGAPPLAEPQAFRLESEAAAAESDGLSFAAAGEPSSGMSEFSFETETGETGPTVGEAAAAAETAVSFEFGSGDSFESSAFGEEPAAAETAGGFEFGSGDSFESSAFGEEPAFGEEGAAAWDQPAKEDGPSFDFDEPSFETKIEESGAKGREEAGMNFGEINFAGEGSGAAPSFGAEPDFAKASLATPAEAAAPPSRPVPSRPRSEEPLPIPAARKNPMTRVMLAVVVLLLVLCGAGGYFYFMDDGRQLAERLLLKVKGEEPPVPLEQRIGLSIAGSNYVDNRDSGQLLVIQGSATNNFAGARSAITVKGLLLDAGGKVLQQQTVFCGNYLSDERLRTMKYVQIEEAMNNQFGDSLANMNVKPGTEIRFTIVFRNPPRELANINVEVVDSKPGGV